MLGRAERARLSEDAARIKNWKRWGPYLADRQWGTVREDYSANGEVWSYFPFDHAHLRTYRWGEDGLLGITDREGRVCFALALWNERDPLLKERLFGLSGPEGNHGEDVKEEYFHLDSTPTHSYLRALYKYPQARFPYEQLRAENRRRGRDQREYELVDTGVFEGGRYWDLEVEYAKADPDDLLIRITAHNRGPEATRLHLLPTTWLRNTWAWGSPAEGSHWPAGSIVALDAARLQIDHPSLGRYHLGWERLHEADPPELLFTENETNHEALWGSANRSPYVKDAFHRRVVQGQLGAVNPQQRGTKAAVWYRLHLAPGASQVVRMRLTAAERAPEPDRPLGVDFDRLIAARRREADAFYQALAPEGASPRELQVIRQAYAGLLWSKKFYHFVVKDWLEGDPLQPAPPSERRRGRNRDWPQLFNRDVISLPDGWEYPWYAAWDLAFHCVAFARIDPDFAKQQLVLLLREWYMHPNGQLPAYEFAFDDANPPVHAWAVWRVYKISGRRGKRDLAFLKRCFHKLTINFTWWVNRKDVEGNNLFSGGFLGLDNIGVFDRSRPLPGGGHLEQADGTAWMAFYCATMLSIALEIAASDPAYEDVASKFFEHFVAIDAAINRLGGDGLWDEHDGFYYDELHYDGRTEPLRIRSMVGIIPLFAVEILRDDVIERLPGFKRRMEWFLRNRLDLALQVTAGEHQGHRHRLLCLAHRERLVRALRRILDEQEFLSPYGVRSLSRAHAAAPFELQLDGTRHTVGYEPGESTSGLFGGNSNWRGPVWIPVNLLLIEALERYHHFYGDDLQVECPTGSGRLFDLRQVAREIERRLCTLFLPGPTGRRPCHGDDGRFASDPHYRELLWFHEYFDGETGRGLGATHQTGWTALVAMLLTDMIHDRG
jgi:hypothetical protein